MANVVGLIGATGLIGCAVAEQLRASGHELRIYGRTAGSVLDLDDPASIAAADLAGIGAFVHCAGATDEDFAADADADAAFRRCTTGLEALTRRLLDAGARRLVYVSTAHVYGPMVGRITEASPALPVSNYAIGHFAAERVLARLVGGSSAAALILRPNAVFGPPGAGFRRWQLIPFSFPRDAVEKGRITLNTPGVQTRNFVGTPTIGALADAFVADPTACGVTVLNPLGRVHESVIDFAHRVARVAGETLGRTVTVAAPPPPAEAPPAFAFASDVLAEQAEPLDLDGFLRDMITSLAQR